MMLLLVLMVSLANTEDNLSSSLLKVASLDLEQDGESKLILKGYWLWKLITPLNSWKENSALMKVIVRLPLMSQPIINCFLSRTKFSVMLLRSILNFQLWWKDLRNGRKTMHQAIVNAYMSLSIPAIFSPYVRLELLKWDPLHEDAEFSKMKWHSLLFNYGLPEDENEINGADAVADDDANLIPALIEKLAIPILHHQLASCWDILSTR